MLDLLRKIFGIHSPSKEAKKKGVQVGRWLVEGIESGTSFRYIGVDLANEKDFTSPPSFLVKKIWER